MKQKCRGKPQRNRDDKGKASILHLVLKTILIAGSLCLIWLYVLTPFRISGNRMSPFLRDGDLGIFYHFEKPRLNEVILYRNSDGEIRTGRVVATKGQTTKDSRHYTNLKITDNLPSDLTYIEDSSYYGKDKITPRSPELHPGQSLSGH